MSASARELEFVRESDALQQGSSRPGHLVALRLAVELARAGKPVDVDTLCQWQMNVAAISVAAVRPGTQPKLEQLLTELNTRAQKLTIPTDVDAASLIGDALYGFSTIDPFEDGRVGRLLAAYLATRCMMPIIVFRGSDRDALRTAARNPAAMRAFVADKMREAVVALDGSVLERTSVGDFTDLYGSLMVERHELLKAQARWLREAEAPTEKKPAGNFGGWVCPRCGSVDVIGRHRTFGTRTIEELHCPSCGLSENADSDNPFYTKVLARWRPVTN